MKRVLKLKRKSVDFDGAKNPQAWRDTSERLLKSAELLWKPLHEAMGIAEKQPEERSADEKRLFSALADHYGAFFVIAGYAVENALKARIVALHIHGGGTLPDGKAVLKIVPTTHNFIALAKRAGVSLTPNEEALLRRLTSYVIWAGRYPIPKEPADAVFKRTTRDNDFADVRAFISRLTLKMPPCD
jgi:hypothetical protein